MKNKSEFSKRLIAIRKRKGLTQVHLSERLHVSIEMVKYYESRVEKPTLEIMLKYHEFLNISLDELAFGSKKAKPGPDSILEEKIDKIAKLPRKQQQRILAIIDTLLATG